MPRLFSPQKTEQRRHEVIDLKAIYEKVAKIFTDDNDDDPPPPAVSVCQWLKHAEAA
jgi:hypothetical protein